MKTLPKRVNLQTYVFRAIDGFTCQVEVWGSNGTMDSILHTSCVDCLTVRRSYLTIEYKNTLRRRSVCSNISSDIQGTVMHRTEYMICCSRMVVFILAFALSILLIPHTGISGTNTEQEDLPYVKDIKLKVELVAEGLRHPTSMVFLGQDDILVLEKDRGTVQRITNGTMNQQPILDVNVANRNERGMLGIAADATSDGRTFVFLYFTQSSKEDGEDVRNDTIPLGNRLYKYELMGDKLVNPKLLFDLPGSRHSAHNGGKILIGPDQNLYLAVD